MMNVTVHHMMEARDRRAKLQSEASAKYGCELVSYTLNIAGSLKRFASGDRCFFEGKREIEKLLGREGCTVYDNILTDAHTGLECIWAVSADVFKLKSDLSVIEESHPLGRLFDIDVISNDGTKIPRGKLDLPERACLVCGTPGKACVRSRAHPVSEVIDRTRSIIDSYFTKKDIRLIAESATRALLYELAATPKPGLVDRQNSGAHKDMDFFTFIDSTIAVSSYFSDMAAAGIQNRELPVGELLLKLRPRGIAAEHEMFEATGGINTHKGLIFSMGIMCAACGYLGLPIASHHTVLDTAAEIAAPALISDFCGVTPSNASTHGERAFAKYALTGIRGEASAGFPSVRAIGFPTLCGALAKGASLGDAGVETLLHLIAHVGDTNVINRAGPDAWAEIQLSLREFLAAKPDNAAILNYAASLDSCFIDKNISPGGCADLLAVTYMLHFIRLLPSP